MLQTLIFIPKINYIRQENIRSNQIVYFIFSKKVIEIAKLRKKVLRNVDGAALFFPRILTHLVHCKQLVPVHVRTSANNSKSQPVKKVFQQRTKGFKVVLAISMLVHS